MKQQWASFSGLLKDMARPIMTMALANMQIVISRLLRSLCRVPVSVAGGGKAGSGR